MGSNISTVKTIRIKNETADYFKKKPLNKYVDSLYEHIQNGDIKEEEDGISVHTKGDSNIPFVSMETQNDIESMCRFFGMSTEEYFKQVCELMNDGYIRGDNGEIKTYDSDGIEMERFKDACHTANRDVQEMIDKCAQLIEKGRI